MEDLNFKLLFNLPIEFNNVGIIYQPTLKEILTIYGFSQYQYLLLPYQVDTDLLNLTEEHKKMFKNFDLFFIKNEENKYLFRRFINNQEINMIDLLCTSLKFYLKNNKIAYIDGDNDQFPYVSIIYNDKEDNKIEFFLNRDNFDDFANIIFKINHTEKPKIEKTPEFKNDIQRDVYEKLMSGRKRNSNNNVLNFESVINSVIHGGKNFIPYNEILNMSIYQLLNSYNSIMSVEAYNLNFKQALACGDSQNLDLTHWSQRLKIK